MIDREALFQLLARKEWREMAKVIHKNLRLIGSDLILQHAVRLFESEFFTETDHLAPKDKLNLYEYPGLLIEVKQHVFSDAFVGRFLDEKLRLLQALDSDALLGFAASHQERPLARDILRAMKAEDPDGLTAARRTPVSVRSTRLTDGQAKTINLFKSRQEQQFFEAVRAAFPTYHPYPNVALSCVLDFDAIRAELHPAERAYFFRAIVDCVVFDTHTGYQPKFFIELDSPFHDHGRAKENDRMKDAIFRAANVKLIRIRAHRNDDATVQRFKQLVLEIMRGL